jgi:hypothetical protein
MSALNYLGIFKLWLQLTNLLSVRDWDAQMKMQLLEILHVGASLIKNSMSGLAMQ